MRPFLATTVGDERYDERLEDPTADGRAAREGLARSTLADLDRLGQERTALAETDIEDAVTGDVLRFLCEVELETVASERWRLLSIDHMDNGPQAVLVMLAQSQRADTPERLDRWLARLSAYPGYIDGHIRSTRRVGSGSSTPGSWRSGSSTNLMACSGISPQARSL